MLLETGAARSLEIVHFGLQYCVASLRLRRAANGDMEMDAQATKLQAAENDLKQLMADVTRAMLKRVETIKFWPRGILAKFVCETPGLGAPIHR